MRALGLGICALVNTFPIGARGPDALGIRASVQRLQLQRRAHREARDVVARGARLDLLQRDRAEVRYRRVRDVGRFLLGHREHRAQLFLAWVEVEGGEGGFDVARPALAVGHAAWDQALQLGAHLFGRGTRRRGFTRHQQRGEAGDGEQPREARGHGRAL